MSLSDMVNYWFEYVLVHKKINHFRSKALKLSWYQYWLVDVMAFVFIILLVIMYVLFIFCVWIKNNSHKQSKKSIIIDEEYQKMSQMITGIHISNRKTSKKRTLSQHVNKTVNQQQVDLQP